MTDVASPPAAIDATRGGLEAFAAAHPDPTLGEMVRYVRVHAEVYRDIRYGWEKVRSMSDAEITELIRNRRSCVGAMEAVHALCRVGSPRGDAYAFKMRAKGKPPLPVRYRTPEAMAAAELMYGCDDERA